MDKEHVKQLIENARAINTTCVRKLTELAMDVSSCSWMCGGGTSSCVGNCNYSNSDKPLPSLTSYCSNMSIYTAIQRVKLKVFDVGKATALDVGVVLYGYVTPALCMLVLLLNTLLVVILSSRRTRSPTNMILCSIAVLDTMTILLPLPWYLFFYTSGGYNEYVPFSWCVVYKYTALVLPTVCHNSSLWLTVALAAHRYIGLCHPRVSQFTSSYKAVTICLLVILVITTVMQSTILLLEDLEPVRVVGKELFATSGVKYVDTCSIVFKTEKDNYLTGLKAYLWTRLIVAELLPTSLLLLFNMLLLRKTCESYRYRRKLISGNAAMSQSDFRECMRTTVMLLTLCSFCVLVQIPVATILFLMFIQTNTGYRIFTLRETKVTVTLVNFVLFLSFPANFAICLGLSEKFRRTLKDKLKSRKRSHSISGLSTSMKLSNSHDLQSGTPMLPSLNVISEIPI
ncbi:sex peptide receptor-like [Mizuhopecten yessoensis]|uniref:FMRFamide receptor n=1 Tax=Mizuhopecten yessoensis TaxID=6573 RepID=A0A210PF41_MIZYE|nr:sex peptide receptor-like [Mizuhopecten yessoensis]OWF35102.1 FMRFamide receptor [Mizuhopecten yessoensis]